MGEKRFLPIQYRDPLMAETPRLAERGAEVEFGDDGKMLSMRPAVRYPDGRVEAIEQTLDDVPPPDSSGESLEAVELPGNGDLEFVSEHTVLTESGSCDLCFNEPSPERTSPGGPTWLRLPVREVHAAYWCPQCMRAMAAAITRPHKSPTPTVCPYCDTEACDSDARYCHVCGSTLKEGGKPHSGEPMFPLFARDPLAPALVRLWAAQQWSEHGDPTVVADARRCADAMDAWRKERP